MERSSLSCAQCGVYHCDHLDKDWPEFCMTTNTDASVFEEAQDAYRNDPEVRKIFQAAAEIEGLYYGRLTRVEEVVLFAKKIGAKKVGIATCMGLREESRTFARILEAKGIESVLAVVCKVGAVDKTEVGIPDDVKVHPHEHESTCNPIVQAEIMNAEHTDLNVIVGLCVGHDTLFMKYSDAPVTYLVVKDRVLAHNPVGALYGSKMYYRRLMSPEDMPSRPREEE